MFLRDLLAKRRRKVEPVVESRSSAPNGITLYAIGDIHGRADLLTPLVAALLEDSAQVGGGAIYIFLGDYIDRGRYSREVLDIVLDLSRKERVVALSGNHEEAMLTFLDDPGFGEKWVAHGGAATLASYGVSIHPDPAVRDWAATRDALAAALPAEHLTFLRSLRVSFTAGDYFFCHAGARPGVPLEAQSKEDLLWIRRDFLDGDELFEKVIVHGHTPEDSIFSGARRVGLDTGAYATGILSAARFLGEERKIFSTGKHVSVLG